MLLALVDWVENGKPVDQVIATTWQTSTKPSSGVARQRPICAYPDTAKWDGKGNVDEAASWSCGLVTLISCLSSGTLLIVFAL